MHRHHRTIPPSYVRYPRGGPVPRGGGCGLVLLVAIVAGIIAAGDWLGLLEWLAIAVGTVLVAAMR